jgi:uncharacterized cupin superfamily protein
LNLIDDAPGAIEGERWTARVWELQPTEVSPYHWHASEEEWVLVLAGRPTVRTPAGESTLEPWDVAAFRCGEAGAHQLRNDTSETVRVAWFATRSDPDVRVYPDDGSVTVVVGGKVLLQG